MDASTEYDGTDNMEIDGMDMHIEGYVLRRRELSRLTTNKYAKRVGAKKAKKLELESRSDSTHDAGCKDVLSAGGSMQLSRTRSTRPSFSSGELRRELSVPSLNSFKKLKR